MRGEPDDHDRAVARFMRRSTGGAFVPAEILVPELKMDADAIEAALHWLA